MNYEEMEEDWKWFADTPEEFENAINNAVSENEREFFEKFRYKLLNETAASNDVLMHDEDNEDGLFILRVGSGDIMLGSHDKVRDVWSDESEYAGIFLAIEQDLFPFIGRHITLLDWLRARDYRGIRYDRNNDYL